MEEQSNQCCYIRKIKPLEEVLSGAVAWVSGLRRAQSPTRANTDFINKDERLNQLKVCPLIYWTKTRFGTTSRVMTYLTMNYMISIILVSDVFHAPVFDSNDSRAGRWSNFEKQNADYMLLTNHKGK